MVSGGIEVNQYAYIRLILEAKSGDNPLGSKFHVTLLKNVMKTSKTNS